MKRLLFILVALAIVVGCEEENKKWDPTAMVSIRPEVGVKSETSNPLHLSALEIVKQAASVWFWNQKEYGDRAVARGFSEGQRDTVNVRLLMFGTDIITQGGNYAPNFIEGEDMVLIRALNPGRDTIAYIPNATLRAAEIKIKEAFAAEDWEACYAIFDEAFTFIPITGAEWQELKKQGIN